MGLAQSQIDKKSLDYKSDPPGTVKFNDSLFIDAVPIDNQMYNEFLDSLKGFWSEKVHDSISELPNYGLSFPDSNINTEDSKDKIVLIFNAGIDTHPLYAKYPRIEIKKSEAELFCKWRTDMVKIYFGTISKTTEERKNYPLNFIYRLPTTNELNMALEEIGYSKKTTKKNRNIPYRVYDRNNNEKIVFMKNNLSEYTLDSTPFGSNWKKETEFTESNDYTGFRCVCEILE